MATPGELVRRMAEVLGVPEPTVVVHDRNLVTAGLRTKGGRGRSAAKMTARDAASLLIAVAGSSIVKDTSTTWNDYATLTSHSSERSYPREKPHSFEHKVDEPGVWKLEKFHLEELRELSDGHTFIDALSGLINSASRGSIQSALAQIPSEVINGYKIPNHFGIEVILYFPFPQATIRIYASKPGFSETMHYADFPEELSNVDAWEQQYQHGDLQQIRQFSQRTIFSLGEIL